MRGTLVNNLVLGIKEIEICNLLLGDNPAGLLPAFFQVNSDRSFTILSASNCCLLIISWSQETASFYEKKKNNNK